MEHLQAKRLGERRASAYLAAKDILERAGQENRDLTSEEESTVEKAYADVDKFTRDIDIYNQQAGLDAKFDALDGAAAEQRARDLTAAGVSTPEKEAEPDTEARYSSAFMDYVSRGDALSAESRQILETRLQETRALGVATGAGGGYTAPAGFWDKVTETMLWYGGMLAVGCEEITTPNGNPLSWPTNDDTANTGSWVAENADNGSATDLSFGQKTLFAHGLSSAVLKVSKQYLQDTEPQTGEAFLAKKIGQRLGRTLNTALTTGNGVGKPYGIINGLSTGKTTAGATAITYGEIIDLIHSVDVAYRANAGFMFHDLIFAYLRKLLDSNGRPIFNQAMDAPTAPMTICGYRFTINNDMDSTVATTKKTAAFGDFGASYVIRTVAGSGELQRLVERYAEYQQVGFISFARYDGNVQDTSAVKLLVQT